MKKVNTNKILDLAKANNPTLVDYVKNWKAEKTPEGMATEDVVTSMKRLRAQKIEVIIGSFFFAILASSLSLSKIPGVLVCIMVAFGLIGFCLVMKNCYPKKHQLWRRKNVREFLIAMNVVDGCFANGFELVDRAEVIKPVTGHLQRNGWRISELQKFPWRKGEVDKKRAELFNLLRIMCKLLSELESDYAAYFPK